MTRKPNPKPKRNGKGRSGKTKPKQKPKQKGKQVFRPRICRICGRTFTPSSTRAITCSPHCSAEYHRQFCLDKAREQAFLTPYDIPAFLAKHPELDPNRPKPKPAQTPKKNPEPSTPDQRAEQLASVQRTMSLPHSQRYPHSLLWSNFQRLAAIAIEKRRIAEDFASPTLFYAYNDQPREPATDPSPEPQSPPSRNRPRVSAATVPTLPPTPRRNRP